MVESHPRTNSFRSGDITMSRFHNKRRNNVGNHGHQQLSTSGLSSATGHTNAIMQMQQMYGNRKLASMLQQEEHDTQDNTQSQVKLSGSPLPAQLQKGLESLSGMDLSNVQVHRQSDKPAQVGAHAYAQGNDIHLGPNQEKHLPHESWHVVQQRQGRVKADRKVNNVAVNEDPALEQEATTAGEQAMQLASKQGVSSTKGNQHSDNVMQRQSVSTTSVLQMVKTAIPKRADNTIQSVRGFLESLAAQANEYIDHPITKEFDWDAREIIVAVQAAQESLETIVTGMNLNTDSLLDKTAILEHYNDDVEWTKFSENANTANRRLTQYYKAWDTWRYINPETEAQLEDTRTGAQLGDEEQEQITFGTFNGILFKVKGSPFPQRTDKIEEARYRSQLKREDDIVKLKGEVESLDMSQRFTVPRESHLRSTSSGAKSILKILEASGDLYISRVMSAAESKQISEHNGDFVPKLGAAKWMTVGSKANIHSSGDSRHDHSAHWKIDANFRKVLLMAGMNNYNENEDSSSDYVEPYWVWKDAEDGNIAISPVLSAIFNAMIKEVVVDGEKIDRS